MYYEINVSLNGRHYFATAEHSLLTEVQTRELFRKFRVLFPEEDGYKVEVSHWKKVGTRMPASVWEEV